MAANGWLCAGPVADINTAIMAWLVVELMICRLCAAHSWLARWHASLPRTDGTRNALHRRAYCIVCDLLFATRR